MTPDHDDDGDDCHETMIIGIGKERWCNQDPKLKLLPNDWRERERDRVAMKIIVSREFPRSHITCSNGENQQFDDQKKIKSDRSEQKDEEIRFSSWWCNWNDDSHHQSAFLCSNFRMFECRDWLTVCVDNLLHPWDHDDDQAIDDQGSDHCCFVCNPYRCPVDNSIFPPFLESGNALESSYEAFRFTESYGVIFQCNVKYCIGRCEPVCHVIRVLQHRSVCLSFSASLWTNRLHLLPLLVFSPALSSSSSSSAASYRNPRRHSTSSPLLDSFLFFW